MKQKVKKQMKDKLRELGLQVTPDKPEEQPEGGPVERRPFVAKLFFKGFTKHEIIQRLREKGIDSSVREIENDLRLIRRQLTPKEERSLNYHRNRSIAGLRQVQSLAWEIIENFVREPGVRLNAAGKYIQAEELVAKVQGLSGEKLITGPDKEAARIMKELQDIKIKAKVKAEDGGNGHHKEEEPALAND